MKTKMRRVHVLALGTGYVESSSWSTLILFHEGGFETIQEALESLRALTVEYLTDEKSDPNDHIEDTWRTIVHGTLQDHGGMWEWLAGSGWDAGPAWLGGKLAKYGICWLEKSPELIFESVYWGSQQVVEYNELDYASHHMHHVPKGTLKFRSEKKCISKPQSANTSRTTKTTKKT